MQRCVGRQVGWTLGLLLSLVAVVSAQAAEGLWSEQAKQVAPAGVDQAYNRPVADGSGGAIVSWRYEDSMDLYVQRLDASGNTLWPSSGVLVDHSASMHFLPQMVPDGNHGVFISWYGYTLQLQHVDGNGTVLWGSPKPLMTSENAFDVHMISDGQNGAYYAIQDYAMHIQAQHTDAQGNTLWAGEGLMLDNVVANAGNPRACLDGQGGAIFVWDTNRLGVIETDVYAQRVSSAGNTLWAQNGVCVSAVVSSQYLGWPAPDGTGGAIISWVDLRYNGTSGTDIFAQRINASGAAVWPAGGVAVCTATGDQKNPVTVSDGQGGAIIFWHDGDIHAQRLDASGNALWAPGGIDVCTNSSVQQYCQAFSDGQGGAIVMWEDARNSYWNPYVQHLDGSGQAYWEAGGVRLSESTGQQMYPTAAPDGQGGLLVAWKDFRTTPNWTTFAQRMTRPKPVLQTVTSPASVGEVKHATLTGLYFQEPAGSVTAARLTRTAQADINATAVNATGRGTLTCDFDLTSAALGDWYVVLQDGYGQQSQEAVTLSVVTPTVTPTSTVTPTATPTATPGLAFNGKSFLAFPNPARRQVQFVLPTDQSGMCKIEIFNLNGERVAEIQEKVAGGNVLIWDSGDCAPGVYLAQVSLNDRVLGKRKIALLK